MFVADGEVVVLDGVLCTNNSAVAPLFSGRPAVGTGGCLRVEGTSSAELRGGVVAFNNGVRGGGVAWGPRVQAVVSGVSFSGNRAGQAGADDVYTESLGLAPPRCDRCVAVDGRSVRLATVSVSAVLGGTVSAAVISGLDVPEPLFTLYLVDAFHAPTPYDNTSVCVVSAFRNDGTRRRLALGHPDTYRVTGGVATIHPFSVTANGASSTLIEVVCDGVLFNSTTIPFGRPSVRWISGPPAALSSGGVDTLYPVGPPPSLVVLDPSGAPLVSLSVTCSVFLAAAPSSTTIRLVGAASTSTVDGVATFSSLGLDAPSVAASTHVPLNASCAVTFTDTYFPDTLLTATVVALRLSWSQRPAEGALPSTARLPVALQPAPRLRLLSGDGNAVEEALPCRAEVEEDGIVTAGREVATSVNSTVSFPSLALEVLSGSLNTSAHLYVTCEWVNGADITSPSVVIDIPAVQPSWVSPPPTYALFNTPLSTAGVSLRLDGLLASSQADADCHLTVTHGEDAIPTSGSADGKLNLATSVVTFPADFRLRPPATAIGVPLTLQASCVLRSSYGVPPLEAAVTVQQLSARFVAPPPTTVAPSSRQQLSGFDVSLLLLNHTGDPFSEEESSAVSQPVCLVSFQDPPDGVALLGPLSALVHHGLATFEGLGVSAPPGSSLVLRVECVRAEGSAAPVLLTAPLSVMELVVDWTSLPPSSVVRNTLLDPLPSIVVRRRLSDPSSSGGDTVPFGSPNDPTRNVSLTCVLSTPSGDVSSLFGGPFDRTRTLFRSSTDSFAVGIAAPPGSTVHLQVTCTLGGESFSSPASPPITVARLLPRWQEAPVPLWLPSSGDLEVALRPHPIVAITGPSSSVLASMGTVVCRVDLSSGSLIRPPPEGYFIAPATGHAVLNRVVPDVAFGAVLNLTVTCTRPAASDTLPPLSSLLRMVDPVLHVRQAPPSTLPSGQPFPVVVDLLDSISHSQVTLDNHTTCTLSLGDGQDAVLTGTTAAAAGGVVSFAVALTGRMGQSFSLNLHCRLGSRSFPSPPPFNLTLDLCPPATQPSASGTLCEPCPKDTYSDGRSSRDCVDCPQAGAECAGGVLTLLPDYYPAEPSSVSHPSYVFDGSTLLHPCWNGQGCVVNLTARSYGCSTGYSGALCGVCDREAGYVQAATTCVGCWPTVVNWLVTSAAAAVVVGAVVYLSVFHSFKTSSPHKIALRIGLSYLQMLASLGKFGAKGTETFRRVFGVADAVGSSVFAAPPLQCALGLSYYTQFSLTLALPVLIAAIGIAANLVVLGWRRRSWCRQRPALPRQPSRPPQTPTTTWWQDVKAYLESKHYLTPVTFVFFLSYNMLATVAVNMLDCRPEEVEGKRYLSSDMSVVCGDGAHTAGVVVAILVGLCFSVGVPVAFVRYLRRHKASLGDADFFSKFGFLYDGYARGRGLYWWEGVVMLRKLSVLVVAVLVKDPWYQIVGAVLVVVTAMSLQMLFHPFDAPLFNILETVTLAALFLTQLISLMYLRSETVAGMRGEPVSPSADTATSFFLILLNGGVVLLILWTALSSMTGVRAKLSGALHRVRKTRGKGLPASSAAAAAGSRRARVAKALSMKGGDRGGADGGQVPSDPQNSPPPVPNTPSWRAASKPARVRSPSSFSIPNPLHAK